MLKQTNTITDSQLIQAISPQILDLHLLPTEQCNFRCTYCYEDFQIGKMTLPVIKGVKNLLRIRTPELKKLRISWFGGEPMAAFDVVKDISHYAKFLAEKNQCQYHFGMTTNGYLLNPYRFQQLIQAGITSLQISLDGYGATHNITRQRADGGATFQRIWVNLIAMSQTDYQFEVLLRIHVTPENYQSLPELLNQIKLTFMQDKRFKIFIKAIANLGGVNGDNLNVLAGESRRKLLNNLEAMIAEHMTIYQLSKNNEPYICYASSQNAWVVRANGTLAKCTVAFDDDRNKIGYLHEDGTMTLEHDKIQLWLRGLLTRDAATVGCPSYNLPTTKQ